MSASLMGDNSPGITAEKKINDQKERRESLKNLRDSLGAWLLSNGERAKMLFKEDKENSFVSPL